MESGITAETGLDEHPLFAVRHTRVESLHTQVEAEQEVIEVESYAQPISHSYFFIKRVYLELASRLAFVVFYRPYISGVDKSCHFEFPDKLASVFGIEVEPYIPALVHKIDGLVYSFIAARAESSYRPSPYTVGPTGKISFFERQ